jgi:hypothetical protein
MPIDIGEGEEQLVDEGIDAYPSLLRLFLNCGEGWFIDSERPGYRPLRFAQRGFSFCDESFTASKS